MGKGALEVNGGRDGGGGKTGLRSFRADENQGNRKSQLSAKIRKSGHEKKKEGLDSPLTSSGSKGTGRKKKRKGVRAKSTPS